MKSVISRVSLLLAVLHLAGTISTTSVQAKTIIPTADRDRTNSITEENDLLASAIDIPQLTTSLNQGNWTKAVTHIEQSWEDSYEDYFGTNFSTKSMTVQQISDTLGSVGTQTGKKPALIYIVPLPQQLELILITPGGQAIHKRITEANNEALMNSVRQFENALVNPIRRNPNRYLPAAQQLYRWMISPLEAELQAQGIDTLLLCVGGGLRTLPLAALHDGQKFLVEKYSFSRIPAFTLTDTVYVDLRNSQVLAMGASEFRNQEPLPAVPAELATITEDLWQGESFLNQEFTVANLQSQRQQQPFQILHLATHADFQPGSPSNSYIQFWDSRLTLDQMKRLRWNYPPVELLVLSACSTALGDEQAELGFAGLAVQSNVKSVVASLWNVSDEGTLGLMAEFYRNLKTQPTKAEALRQAQIAMLRGQVRLAGGQLHTPAGTLSLPSSQAVAENENLSHPFYWAAFTVVGSPW